VADLATSEEGREYLFLATKQTRIFPRQDEPEGQDAKPHGFAYLGQLNLGNSGAGKARA